MTTLRSDLKKKSQRFHEKRVESNREKQFAIARTAYSLCLGSHIGISIIYAHIDGWDQKRV